MGVVALGMRAEPEPEYGAAGKLMADHEGLAAGLERVAAGTLKA